jgi:hypothetical protein
MALTAEQQAEIMPDAERMNLLWKMRRARAEVIRLAKETLIENDRNKPTGERGVTAADITAFADTLD